MAGEEYAAQAADMANRLRDEAARLTAAAEAATAMTSEASCAVGRDGTVSVTATGGGRVREVSVDPRALRVPLPELGDAAAQAVSQAIGAARERAASSGPDVAPPPGPDAEQFAGRLADERVSASSADRQVTVTATGTGGIQSVRIEEGNWREQDSRALGADIVAASNGALEAARRLQQRLLDPIRQEVEERNAPAEEVVARHARRMDELLDRLAETERQIGDW